MTPLQKDILVVILKSQLEIEEAVIKGLADHRADLLKFQTSSFHGFIDAISAHRFVAVKRADEIKRQLKILEAHYVESNEGQEADKK